MVKEFGITGLGLFRLHPQNKVRQVLNDIGGICHSCQILNGFSLQERDKIVDTFVEQNLAFLLRAVLSQDVAQNGQYVERKGEIFVDHANAVEAIVIEGCQHYLLHFQLLLPAQYCYSKHVVLENRLQFLGLRLGCEQTRFN